jgi:hypothetical protein
MNDLVLYESRGPHMWQPGCAGIGVLIGVAAILAGQPGGIVLVVPFGLFLALSILWFRKRPDRLTIDEAGFTIAHGAFDSRCMWSDIARVAVVRGQGRPWVHIEMRPESQVSYPWRRALPGSARRTAAALPAGYGIELDELAALMEGRRRRAAAQVAGHPDAHTEPTLPAGYMIREAAEGGEVEIIRPGVTRSCSTLFIGLWIVLWDVVTLIFVIGLVRDGFDPVELVGVAIAVAVGAAFTVVGLRAILSRRSWVLSDGVVIDRTAVPRVGEFSRTRYDVQRIEMRSGLWDTGAGRTDELVLWAEGSKSPVVVHPSIENAAGHVRALGELFARHTNRPFTTVEEHIKEPKPPDED